MREVDRHEERDGGQDADAEDERTHERRRAHAEQMREPRDRRHERVLDRAFPALPRDDLADVLEDDAEESPRDRPDEQVEHEPRDRRVVDPTAGDGRRGEADVRDGERGHDAVDEPDDLPRPVALGQRDLALDERVREADLPVQLSDHSCFTAQSI